MQRTGLAAIMGAVLSAAVAVPAAAQSENAVVTTDLYLRTGPDTAYPPVAILPAGAPVVVYGCVNGWIWCDVSWGPQRGWVAGSYLQAIYQDQRIPFVQYGPRRGIPIIVFSLGNYWDRFYRGRPWYADRGRWEGWDHDAHRWRDGRDSDKRKGSYERDKPPAGYDDKRDTKPPAKYDDKNKRRGRYDDKSKDKPPAKYDDKDKRRDDKGKDKPPVKYDDKKDKDKDTKKSSDKDGDKGDGKKDGDKK